LGGVVLVGRARAPTPAELRGALGSPG
jgi:hypothetical protein